MDSLFFSVLLSLLFLSTSSAVDGQGAPQCSEPATSPQPQIHDACKATRFPEKCEAFLLRSGYVPPNPSPVQIIQSAISISSENLKTAQSMVKSILDSSAGSQDRTTAAKNCLDVLHNAEYRISSTAKALPIGRIKDARSWMSAALVFQYDCWSALKYANDTVQVSETMSFLNSTLIVMTSNGLSMMASYDIFGNEISSWRPPKTERDGFWEDSGGGKPMFGFQGGVPKDLKPNATVCKGCDGSYKTVQEAVNAAPENDGSRRFVIWIRKGVYEETVRVPLEKKNVVFLGDGKGKTVITGSLNVGMPGISTYNSATVAVAGDGFMASGLTIQNTAGPVAHQAVAFRSDSDQSVIENCEFISNQDTLYVHSDRQFYKSCRIEGNVDFIFGNAATIFQDCLILIRPRQLNPETGENNAVTAHGRTDPAQTTGLVFRNCVVNGTEDYMKLYYRNPKVHGCFLGRPWKEYSRTVFIKCDLEVLIAPQGWMPWNGNFSLATLYYGEFKNRGLGANLSERVEWSSRIPGMHVGTYSVQNFIQGDKWIPQSFDYEASVID